jgi:hypothetical protein
MVVSVNRSALRLATLMIALGSAESGCGASLHAVYEGDVRFEHCMALDAQPTIKPSVVRECWTEWVNNYTYGQTKDRVRHAQLRIQQLSDVSASGQRWSAEVPAPIAAHQGDKADPSLDRCAGDCRDIQEDCSRECENTTCHKSCSAGFQTCVRECG